MTVNSKRTDLETKPTEHAAAAVALPKVRLVVCDVDGVLVRGYFPLALARRCGLLAGLLSLLDSVFFVLGAMTLERFLERVYRRAAGQPVGMLHTAYASLRVTPGAKEAVAEMRAGGREVWLLSSGAPDEIVEDLAKRLGADGGKGIRAERRDGRLTGRVSGLPSLSTGKEAFVERLLDRRRLRWDDVAVVADDRANLDILRRAGTSIGFCSDWSVRREAQFLVDEQGFARVARIVSDPEEAALEEPCPCASPLPEIRRKMIHGLGVLAVFVHPVWPTALNAVLLLSALAYLVIEFLRVNGMAVPIFGEVARLVIRREERRRPAWGPIALAAGVLGSVWIFPAPVAYAAVLAATVADGAAALVGMNWGRLRLPYNRHKTLEGTLATFAAATACSLPYLSLGPALAAGVAGALTESLDLGDWDNLCLPFAAGAAALVAQGWKVL